MRYFVLLSFGILFTACTSDTPERTTTPPLPRALACGKATCTASQYCMEYAMNHGTEVKDAPPPAPETRLECVNELPAGWSCDAPDADRHARCIMAPVPAAPHS